MNILQDYADKRWINGVYRKELIKEAIDAMALTVALAFIIYYFGG